MIPHQWKMRCRRRLRQVCVWPSGASLQRLRESSGRVPGPKLNGRERMQVAGVVFEFRMVPQRDRRWYRPPFLAHLINCVDRLSHRRDAPHDCCYALLRLQCHISVSPLKRRVVRGFSHWLCKGWIDRHVLTNGPTALLCGKTRISAAIGQARITVDSCIATRRVDSAARRLVSSPLCARMYSRPRGLCRSSGRGSPHAQAHGLRPVFRNGCG